MRATCTCDAILPLKAGNRFTAILKSYWATPIGCEITARWLAEKRTD